MGPGVANAWRGPRGCPRRGLTTRKFRGSIAQRLISLSTLRSGGHPPPRKTRFRLLARLCRTGLVTRRVPIKGFTFERSSFSELLAQCVTASQLCEPRTYAVTMNNRNLVNRHHVRRRSSCAYAKYSILSFRTDRDQSTFVRFSLSYDEYLRVYLLRSSSAFPPCNRGSGVEDGSTSFVAAAMASETPARRFSPLERGGQGAGAGSTSSVAAAM